MRPGWYVKYGTRFLHIRQEEFNILRGILLREAANIGEWVVVKKHGKYRAFRCSCGGVTHYEQNEVAVVAANYLNGRYIRRL